MTASDKQIIILDDGRMGHLRQCQALAKAVTKQGQRGCDYICKSICLDQTQLLIKEDLSDTLLIGCGRRSAAVSKRLKSVRPDLFNVQILDPRWYRSTYDLLVIPAHDQIKAHNVIVIQGSLHALNQKLLNQIKQQSLKLDNPDLKPVSALILSGSKKQNKRLLSFAEQKSSQHTNQFVISISPRQEEIDWSSYPRLKQKAICLYPKLLNKGDDAYLELLVKANEFFVAAESINQLNEVLAARNTQSIWLVSDGVKGRKKRFIKHVQTLGLAEELEAYRAGSKQTLDCEWREQLTQVAEKVYKSWRNQRC